MPGNDEALSKGKSNPTRNSQVVALVDPEPLVFYQPFSGELWVVPAEHKTAFETECRLMDKLMYDLCLAKEEYQKAQEEWLAAERAGAGPGRTIPQHPNIREQAKKKLEAAEKKLEAAQKAVDEEFKPLGQLDDTGGKLTELIPIRQRAKPKAGAKTSTERTGHAWAQKWTYVRDDKVKSKRHVYPLGKGDQKDVQSQSGSFVKDGKLDTKALNEQLSKLETSTTWKQELAKSEVQGALFEGINRSIEATLNEWADGLNGDVKQKVELKPEVQLLRYFAGAGVSADWDPRKKNLAVRADARAEFALAEGKIKAGGYWPSRGGHMIKLVGPKSGTTYEAGLIRCGFELELFGMAGASACGQLGLEVDYSGVGGKKKAALRGRPTKKPLSSKGLTLGRQVRDGAELSAAGDLFAGVRVNGSVKGGIHWNDPEEKEFSELATIGPGGQLQAGAGISGQFKIDYNNGKFRFLAAGAVCWGVGAGGKLEFEVDIKQTANFVRYLAYMLFAVGYEFVEIFTEQAFEAWTNFSLWAIQEGKQVADAVEEFGDRFERALELLGAQFEKEAARVALMNRVLANPQALEYAPPETKGMILYQLTRHGTLTKAIPQNYDWSSPDTLGRRKRAVLTVLSKKTRAKAEFRNVLQHMTVDGRKHPAGWQHNNKEVQAFLNMGIDTRDMDEQLRTYERSLSMIYNDLYDQPVLGHAFVDSDSPQYALNAGRGDHAGYMVAGGYDPGPVTPVFDGMGSDVRPDMRYA